MEHFIREVVTLGIREGLVVSLVSWLVASHLRSAGLAVFRRSVFAGIAVVCIGSFAVLAIPVTSEVREFLGKLTGYVFGLFYIASLGLLYDAVPRRSMHGGGPRAADIPSGYLCIGFEVLLFLATALYFLPDIAVSALYLKDIYSMSGQQPLLIVLACGAFLLALIMLLVGLNRISGDVARLFGLPQLLLFLALIKLVAGGVSGFADFSLIPAVKAGLMKLVHDIIHQTFVTIMVPDHLILTTTAWNFIGVLFGDAVALWLSFIIMTMPIALFLRRSFTERIAIPVQVATASGKRKFLKAVKDERLLRSLPMLAFLLYILAVWNIQHGENSAVLYNPDPLPLSATGNALVIPLHAPGAELQDGALHKYVLMLQGEPYRLLILKKPDGRLAVCLDACELCQPDGYAQATQHLVCLWCKTPISFETVGVAGGCNPIPLAATITDTDVRIDVNEILVKWKSVNLGKEGAAR